MTHAAITEKEMRKIGYTALFMVLKHELGPAVKCADIANASHGAVSPAEMKGEEFNLFNIMLQDGGCSLTNAGWLFLKPTPLSFLDVYLKAAGVSTKADMAKLAGRFAEQFMLRHNLQYYRPSAVAAATVYLALRLNLEKSEENYYPESLQKEAQYTLPDLE